jgi:putative membrane protein
MKRIRWRGLTAILFIFFGVPGVVLGGCDVRRDEPTPPPVKSQAVAAMPAARSFGLLPVSSRPSMQLAQTSPRSSPSPGTMGGKAVSAADVEFVANAASAGTLEVEASRVALEKTKSPAVRDFAQKLIEEHSKAGAELRALKVASSVGNVAAMSPQDGEQLRRLKALQGREFDREYVAQIGVAAHQDAVGAFEKAADRATDNQVKVFAQAKLPALREHLKTAQGLAKELGARTGNSKSESVTTGSSK